MEGTQLLRAALWGILLPLISAQVGILHASKNDQPQLTKNYCIFYNSNWTSLPKTLSGTYSTNLIVLTPKLFCNYSEVLTENIKDKAVAVKRGNCTFLEKALIAQSHGAKILLIVSEIGEVPAGGKSITVNIQVALIRSEEMWDMQQTLGNNINVALYSPPTPVFDYSMAIIFLIAVFTVAVGGYWSGILELENLKASTSFGSLTESQGNTEENLVLTPVLVVVFVISSSVTLILLYFFYKWLVYFVIALFCFATTSAMFSCLAALITKIPFGRCSFPIFCITRIEVRLIFLFGICMATSIVWAVFRKEDRWAWILQDILGVFLCIHFLKTLKLPHFKSCVLLLGLLLVYDVFFVFITPFITKVETETPLDSNVSLMFIMSGESVMVEVAAGPPDSKEQNDGNLVDVSVERSAPHEKLPLLIKIPRLQFSAVKLCYKPFTMLGYGDIIIPGLLVAYCHRFDVQISSPSVYFISSVIAYAVGLVVTFVALTLMRIAQPALLYLAPCTLITSAVVACCRKEMKKFWHGSNYQEMDHTAREQLGGQ